RLHPDLPISGGDANSDHAADSPIIRCGDDAIVVMLLPMPMPQDVWEMPCRRVTGTWPEARKAFEGHRAHLVVSTVGPTDNRLRTARSIAAAVGAIAATHPGCRAVLWEALVAHSPERWLEMSRDVFAPYPRFPYPLWVSIHPFRDAAVTGAITFGLLSFVDREIELEGVGLDAATIVNKVAGLATYLIEHGPVLQDGAPVGATPAERLQVRHQTSRRVAGLPVFLTTPEAA